MSASRSFAFAALATLVAWPLAANALDLPIRKDGLWQLTLSASGQASGTSLQQCTDAATDKLFSAASSPVPADTCSRNDITQSSNGYAIDSVCTTGGRTSTTHSDITGDFNSQYSVQVASRTDGTAGTTTMRIDASWTGICSYDQKPGDVVLPDGSKVNVVDLNSARSAR